MQKKILRKGTLQLPCNQVKPGAVLSSWGINMPNFCREFNARTSNQEIGEIVNVKIKVFDDKSFEFEVKSPPTSLLLKKFLNASDKTISSVSLDKIVKIKMNDLNTDNEINIRKIILGSAKSAGMKVRD
jgi:large subunit ribosomal protein L11